MKVIGKVTPKIVNNLYFEIIDILTFNDYYKFKLKELKELKYSYFSFLNIKNVPLLRKDNVNEYLRKIPYHQLCLFYLDLEKFKKELF